MLNLFKYKRNIYSFIKFNYSSIPYMNFDISKLEKMDMKEGIADHLQQNLINLYKEFIDALGKKDENFINNNCQKQFSKEIIENFVNQRELSVNKDKKVEVELMNYEFHFKLNSDRMKNRKHNVKLRKVRSKLI